VEERVQKLMAQANIGSRRHCEALISEGRVRVNGQVVGLGAKADPDKDTILVDGEKLLFAKQRKIYILLNKPRNVLTTNKPHKGDERQTVRELVPFTGEHLFTVGRLDADSEGLVVLTNDGELVQRLTHPKYRHTKTYKVTVYGLPNESVLERWQKGVMLDDEDGMTAPCVVKITHGDRAFTTLQIIMTEGKKRQIRRVATILGHPVRQLMRTHIGKLGIGSLRPGEWRELTAADLDLLKQSEPLPKRERRGFRPAGKPAFTTEPRSTGRRSDDERPRQKSTDKSDQPARKPRPSGRPGASRKPTGKPGSGRPNSKPRTRK
jgi:pseudouridine synthase